MKELQLLLAVQDNNFEQVISLLKDSSKILSDAVESVCALRFTKHLLELIMSFLQHGQTLLMSASLRGSVDIISSLIDHGASINVQDVSEMVWRLITIWTHFVDMHVNVCCLLQKVG